jgi:CCR4-NOT transcription complex subunit 1
MSQAVKVSDDLVSRFSRFYNFNEHQVRKLVGMAVDNSIVEILPPVVDRSVTIALITTRELVLKDFARDGDYERVVAAARLIVQNLAGSLALVTCREPLRMSLTTNLDVVKGSTQPGATGEGASGTTGAGAGSTSGATAGETTTAADAASNATAQLDSNGYQTSVTEELINEIAVLASRENLELGCRLIKKEVIEKALKKVREDPQIQQAVDRRKRAEEQGERLFRDDAIAAQFRDLPEQLQPDENGLSAAQFQVYADFALLGHDPDMPTTPLPQTLPQQPPQGLTSILR